MKYVLIAVYRNLKRSNPAEMASSGSAPRAKAVVVLDDGGKPVSGLFINTEACEDCSWLLHP